MSLPGLLAAPASRSTSADTRDLSSRRAAQLASRVRQIGIQDGFPDGPEGIVGQLQWTVSDCKLSADTGGVDALLVPFGVSFRCIVDPALSLRERWQCAGEPGSERERCRQVTRQFRIAHEIGHSLFYDDGPPPRRTSPVSAAEERFCDAFALGVLIPPERLACLPSTAANVVRLATETNLTLALVALAAVLHGDVRAAVGGTVHEGSMRIEWHVGLDFDPTGWLLPTPQATEAREAWRTVADEGDAVSSWADERKALVLIA